MRITAVHLEGGHGHEHIAKLQYHWDGDSTAHTSSRDSIVDWLEQSSSNTAYTEPRIGRGAQVYVRHVGYQKFLQTKADGMWTNNLLQLPIF
ncbi:DUF3892 domain-containing protein [Amycolatopsis sp. NPDC059657]|uniref:DUF3892 domain-containing protein n=1 Tax=Amycolatopsis sp. NPDC059657 TaxID=3346899 RepID=UPI003670613A